VNIRFVISQLGILFVGLSIALLAVAGWSGCVVLFAESPHLREIEWLAFKALLISAIVGLVLGLLLWLMKSRDRKAAAQLGRREAFLLVGLSWLFGAALAALPFFLWAHFPYTSTITDSAVEGSTHTAIPSTHVFRSWVDCYFEAMSGLTTAGSTVLTNIADMPRGILLWRSLIQWLGGLGIVVLFVAVLPSLGVGGKKLFRVEAPGPTPEGVRPHIRETARILWFIYVGMTITQTILLRLAGMSWFDSICHTFTTLATGGYSTMDASIGGFRSPMIDTIVLVFMFLAGVNFGLYYHLIRKRFNVVWKDAEFRLYVTVLLIGSLIMIFSIMNRTTATTDGLEVQPGLTEAVRYGVFTTVSIQTTTGYCTADYETWPWITQVTLIILMFVGASAGSTGGGIKIIRILIMFKVLAAELEHSFRPQVVRSVKIGASTVSSDLRLATLSYILIVILIYLIGSGLLLVFEPQSSMDLPTAFTASAATLFNIGPGLARVGATQNFEWFSPASKILMSLLMVIGRLEVFAIVVLFSPRFWRSD